jgi:hypothetical protein
MSSPSMGQATSADRNVSGAQELRGAYTAGEPIGYLSLN